VFRTALLPFFQLRSSSTVPNTSSSTNSAPRKTWSYQLHVFLRVPQWGTPPTPRFLWSSTCSTNSTVELLHGRVRGAELEKREQNSPKHPRKSAGAKKICCGCQETLLMTTNLLWVASPGFIVVYKVLGSLVQLSSMHGSAIR
jgi:hypothetical protein